MAEREVQLQAGILVEVTLFRGLMYVVTTHMSTAFNAGDLFRMDVSEDEHIRIPWGGISNVKIKKLLKIPNLAIGDSGGFTPDQILGVGGRLDETDYVNFRAASRRRHFPDPSKFDVSKYVAEYQIGPSTVKILI